MKTHKHKTLIIHRDENASAGLQDLRDKVQAVNNTAGHAVSQAAIGRTHAAEAHTRIDTLRSAVNSLRNRTDEIAKDHAALGVNNYHKLATRVRYIEITLWLILLTQLSEVIYSWVK